VQVLLAAIDPSWLRMQSRSVKKGQANDPQPSFPLNSQRQMLQNENHEFPKRFTQEQK